jgi:hypothetical protein
MSDEHDQERVARALRALPQLTAPADGWARLARRLDARPTAARPRTLALAAAALGLAALALWPALRPVPPEQPAQVAAAAAAAAAADPAAPPADLEARSADLERLLAALPRSHAARASTGLTALLLEDRIALVDERLSGPGGEPLPPAATRALLRERVALLDSLVRVRSAASVGQTL